MDLLSFLHALLQWIGLFALLVWAATLLSIYNQERRIPTFGKVWRTMIWRLTHFPSSLAYRVRSAPLRARNFMHSARERFAHAVALRLLFLIPRKKGKVRSSTLARWVEKHRFPIDEAFLFPVKWNSKQLSLGEALLRAPSKTRFKVHASHVEHRFSSKRWHAFEVHAHHFRVWCVSTRKELPLSFDAELRRSGKGVYLVRV